MSNSLWPHEQQYVRPPCPSPTPRVHPNPCPLSQWCHPTISSSVVPFSSCPQSFPASGSFPAVCIRWPKYWSFSFQVLSFFYGPTLTSIHDYQKNHNFDYRDRCHIKFNCGWFFSLWYFLNFLWTSLFLSLAYNYPHLWLGHILCWEDREQGKAMDLYRLLWSQFHLI